MLDYESLATTLSIQLLARTMLSLILKWKWEGCWTYSASIVNNFKLGHLRPAPLSLLVVGRLVGMGLVELLQVALVAALWEEALLVQQSQDSHGLSVVQSRRREKKEGRGSSVVPQTL